MLKLDGLSLAGFKSFADRTDLVFPDGITCVVGPNGCGKSNILDAISWVLGEQSPKTLRGSKMEEVIFAGTKTRKPAGMAEVTLKFSPKASMAGLHQDDDDTDLRLHEPLTITRRLFRNGDSEYLINEGRARLKDIVQLIAGTGMGTRVYSIIEQGRIGQILQSKPTDRRILIEEAAGVTRYKAKRKAAKLKLDESEQNLLRVSDITGELDKQLRSLKRQVSTARRYKRLASRRRVVLRALHAVKFRDLSGRAEVASGELDVLRGNAVESGETLARLEEQSRSAREQVAEVESRRDVVSQSSHGLHLELDRAQHVIETARKRIAELETRGRDASEAVRRNEEDCAELDRTAAEHAARLAQLDKDLASSRDAATEHGQQARSVREKLSLAHRQIAESKELIFEVMSEAAGLRNRKQELESALVRLDALVTRLAAGLAEGDEELARALSELAAGEQRLERALAQEAEIDRSLKQTASQLEAASSELSELRAGHDKMKGLLNDSEWQMSALAETIRSRASYGDAVRELLANPPAGVLGAVADFVTVTPGDELASEKAFGGLLQAVACDSRETAERIARKLAEGAKAEIHLVFPDPATAAETLAPPADRRVLGAMSDSISFEGDAGWLAALVPAGWICATAKDAIALARKHPDHVFVSRDGVRLGPGGQGSAGRPLGESDGILETQSRHRGLEKHVAARRAELEAGAARLAAVEARREELAAERLRLQVAFAGAEREAISARHGIAGLRQSAGAAEARLSSMRVEHETAADEARIASERTTELTMKLAAAAQTKTDLERKLIKLNEQASRLEQEVEGADLELSRLREELAVKNERREAFHVEVSRLQVEVERRRTEREAAAARSESIAGERAQAVELIAQAEAAIAAGTHRWESLKSELEAVELSVREGRAGILDSAERLRDLRLEHERRSRLAAESELRRERLVMELQHVVADCRDKLSVEPADLPVPEPPVVVDDIAPRKRRRRQAEDQAAAVSDTSDSEQADVSMVAESSPVASEVEAPTASDELEEEGPEDESLPWREGVLDLGALEAESEDLRKRLDRVGPVNLVAIEEYDGLAERHSFLSKEQADLVTSIRSLRHTISEIDAMSRERFNEAFEQVRISFDQAFQTLFRGGRAELKLQDEDDPLECGIEIIAQPPGKRLQNMMLLSGGEKALTAIALLFALFRYKPSPFCVLDEVDAPLDESNVLRFLDLVSEMARDTQFVLITHDRRSMERGNVLYGVTMQEPGSSKLVGVHFEGLNEISAA